MWHVNLTLPYLVPHSTMVDFARRRSSSIISPLSLKRETIPDETGCPRDVRKRVLRTLRCFRKQYLHSDWTDIQRIDSPAILWSENVQS